MGCEGGEGGADVLRHPTAGTFVLARLFVADTAYLGRFGRLCGCVRGAFFWRIWSSLKDSDRCSYRKVRLGAIVWIGRLCCCGRIGVGNTGNHRRRRRRSARLGVCCLCCRRAGGRCLCSPSVRPVRRIHCRLLAAESTVHGDEI